MTDSGITDLYVTSAPNDADLARELGPIAIVLPIKHGDVNIFGYQDGNGDPIRVCVERKHIQDMVNCILGGRYLHQVRSAHDAGFRYQVLVLEARDIRPGPRTGLLEALVYRPAGRKVSRLGSFSFRETGRRVWSPVVPEIPYSRFDQFLTEIQRDLGIIYKRSQSVTETASIVRAIWSNFQKRPEEHNSLQRFYSPPCTLDLLQKPGIVRRVAKELTGVGWDRSGEIARHFRTVRQMVNATEEEWRQIPGIGKKLARSVFRELGGEG